MFWSKRRPGFRPWSVSQKVWANGGSDTKRIRHWKESWRDCRSSILTHSESYLISVAAIRYTVLSKLPMKLWRGRLGPLQKREVSRRRSTFWHHLVELVVSMLVRLLRSVGFLARMSHINYIGTVTGNPKSIDSQIFVDPLGVWPCSCRPVRGKMGCHIGLLSY